MMSSRIQSTPPRSHSPLLVRIQSDVSANRSVIVVSPASICRAVTPENAKNPWRASLPIVERAAGHCGNNWGSMYTKRNYSVKDMVWWTRQDTVLLLVIALIPVVVYEAFDQKWLHLPWLPIAVVGTAVAPGC